MKLFILVRLNVRCPVWAYGSSLQESVVSSTRRQAARRCPNVNASSLKQGSIPRHSGHLNALLSQLPARKSAINGASFSSIGADKLSRLLSRMSLIMNRRRKGISVRNFQRLSRTFVQISITLSVMMLFTSSAPFSGLSYWISSIWVSSYWNRSYGA